METTLETVKYRDEGAVRLLTMNRPEALNAFNAQMMDDLADVLYATAKDTSIKVLVLTGEGKAFTAGADLKEMGEARGKPKHGWPGFLDAVVELPQPFFLAVNGVGAGVGATICGLADFTFMAEGARLRCPFSALGVTAEAGSTFLFPQLMGRQHAAWFLLSSEWMSADDCLKTGLVMEVVPPEELMPRVLERAGKLAALPAASLRRTKKLMMDPIKAKLREVFAAENAGLAELTGGPANREALAAFREKRQPDFSGL